MTSQTSYTNDLTDPRAAPVSMAKLVSSLVAIGSPRWWPTKVLAVMPPCSGGAVGESVAVAGGGDDVGVVAEPVEQRDGGGLVGQEPSPVLERAVRADGDGASFVAGGDEAEQELAAGVIERGEADLVDDDEVVAAHGFDGFADGVVGDGAVEVLDEFDGGEVADLVAGGRRRLGRGR